IVFGDVIRKMKKIANIAIDEDFMLEFSKHANLLNADEFDFKEGRRKIAKLLKIDEEELMGKIRPLQALYAIADHLRAFLYAYNDGMLPSNSGGGYNIRMILRKAFAENEEFGFGLDFGDIIEWHAKELSPLDATLKEGIEIAKEVLHEEYKKFTATKERAKAKLKAVIEQNKKQKKPITKEQQIMLYESYGIPIEMIRELAKKEKIKVEDIPDIYKLLAKKNVVEKEDEKSKIDVSKFPKTKKLFYEDVNLKTFNAKIIGIIESALILDRTAFYAESGGQQADSGTISGIKVLDVQEIDGVILHYVEKPEVFSVGQKVVGEVDFNKRKILMRHHTATHLLNAAARHLLGKHIWQSGAFKGVEKAHLDITHYKRITEEELEKLEMAVNKMIQENVAVEISVMPRDEAEKKFGFRIYQGGYVPGKEIRIVNIKGYDVEACGGLHVANTGEIGFFKILKRESIKDGVERITFVAGMPALLYVQEMERKLKETASILKTPIAQLEKTSIKLMEELKNARKELEKIKVGYAENEALALLKEMKNHKIIKLIKDKSRHELIKIAENIIKKDKKALVILANSSGDIISLCGEDSSYNAKEELEKIFKKCNGKGGGNKRLAQGKILNVENL
ncbi:MAG: alanine--tRNA ligase, partial [Candidatus Iainarchaeum archaeon]